MTELLSVLLNPAPCLCLREVVMAYLATKKKQPAERMDYDI